AVRLSPDADHPGPHGAARHGPAARAGSADTPDVYGPFRQDQLSVFEPARARGALRRHGLSPEGIADFVMAPEPPWPKEVKDKWQFSNPLPHPRLRPLPHPSSRPR